MSTLVLSGSYVGNVVSFPLTGYLCQCGFGGGWPSVFYTFGEYLCVCLEYWRCSDGPGLFYRIHRTVWCGVVRVLALSGL